MKKYSLHLVLLLISTPYLATTNNNQERPRLTLIIVLDGCGQALLQKTLPFMRYGLKNLFEKGVVYSNAFQPHGMPETAVGHTGIGTGALAKDHGIVGNSWIDQAGNLIGSDQDSAENAAVFSPTGLYSFGRSGKNIQVDTLADQISLNSNKSHPLITLSLSNKSRAAISMAGKAEHCFWFDDLSGNYTSSIAYCKELPEWVKKFNKNHKLPKDHIMWKPFFDAHHPAYNFPESDNYHYSTPGHSLLGKPLTLGKSEKEPLYYYEKTPHANKRLLEFAFTALKEYKDTGDLVMHLSISNPDKMLHILGPNSKEALDMMYHLDHQIGIFLNKIKSLISEEKVVIAVTADHGFGPIYELADEEHLNHAHRFKEDLYVKNLNNFLYKHYNIDGIVKTFYMPYIYLNEDKLQALDVHMYDKIIKSLISHLRALPEIQDAWTREELSKTCYAPDDARTYLKNQLFYERIGHIVVLMQPYNTIESFSTGTSHNVPYVYNTQVPLCVYQKNKYANKQINTRVYIQQLPVTLAEILKVPRPSAAFFDYLPGIIEPIVQTKNDALSEPMRELNAATIQEEFPEPRAQIEELADPMLQSAS